MAAIVPIVEGQGEEAAVPELLRRLLGEEFQRYDITVARPFRVKRGRVVKPGELERNAELATRSREGASAVLVVLDSDDDDPRTLRDELAERLRISIQLPSAVVTPVREYEAWLLAGKSSLRGVRRIRGDATVPPNPEDIRDCKGRLQANMEPGARYLPVVDQVALTARLDIRLAMGNSPSLRTLVDSLGELLSAI
jgi:hypothetical protein